MEGQERVAKGQTKVNEEGSGLSGREKGQSVCNQKTLES